MTNSQQHPAPKLTPVQESDLMTAFRAWFGLWCAAGETHGSERNTLDAAAADIFRAQLARGGVYRDAWILMQDTLSAWWELPEQMRDFLRVTPVREGFAARAVRTAVLEAEGDQADDE
jgi:hypothetical protein